jgi:DNA primase
VRDARRHRGRAGAKALGAAEFRRLVDEAKVQHNISDVVALDRKVIRAGREKRALCAFHNERSPSMQVNDAKGTFHCFGCGASGDIVTYVMETQRVGFRDALRWLGAADLPAVDPSLRAKAAEEDEADRAAAIAEAQAIWDSAVPAHGTPAETYLRSRGITMPIPPTIRFGRVYAWKDADTGEIGPELPALIGAVTTGDELTGLQRIFLRDGGRGKASMKKPKKSLGRIRGGALRLDGNFPASSESSEVSAEGLAWAEAKARRLERHPNTYLSDAEEERFQARLRAGTSEVIITEGPEDGLSLAQELPGKRVWAALGTAMMPEIVFPAHISSIVIAGQNDAAGRTAVDKAALRLVEQGFAVRTMYPAPEFKDWNDQLRGIRA